MSTTAERAVATAPAGWEFSLATNNVMSLPRNPEVTETMLATPSASVVGLQEIDTFHAAVAPLELGAGSRLWDSPDDLLDRYHRDVVPSASGVVHHLFWRD